MRSSSWWPFFKEKVMQLSRILTASIILATSSALFAASAPPAPVPTDIPPVNARRALASNISDLNVEAVALSRVIDYLKSVSGANIVVNWKVLEGAGISKDTPVTLQVRDLSLRKMLRLVLDQVSPNTLLVFNTDANVVEVTTQDEADKVLITKVYVVDDLVMPDNRVIVPPQMNLSDITKGGTTTGGSGSSTGGGSLFTDTSSSSNTSNDETSEKKGQDLVALVRDVVRPTIWKENGGTASIRYFSGKLIVSAPASVHEAIGGPLAPEGGQRFGM
jgi:hypothetical protein